MNPVQEKLREIKIEYLKKKIVSETENLEHRQTVQALEKEIEELKTDSVQPKVSIIKPVNKAKKKAFFENILKKFTDSAKNIKIEMPKEDESDSIFANMKGL